MVKGFIFDLDGVIVDTAKYHYLAWKELTDALKINFTESHNEELKGISRRESLNKIIDWGNLKLTESDCEQLMQQKNKLYLNYIDQMDESDILPDVNRVLNFLRFNNQLVALGSASKNAKYILKKLNLFDNFHVIVDGTCVVNTKPNPEVFLTAAEKLNLKASDCIVFEDAEAGILAANTANMTSVGIGSKEILGKAKDVFSDFTKISNQYLNDFISKK